MKRLIPFLLITAIACKSKLNKQQQAEETVKLYLDSTLNNPKTYQSVKFDKVDTVFSSVSTEPVYKAFEAKYDSLKQIQDNSKSYYEASSIQELHKLQGEKEKIHEALKKTMEDEIKYIDNFKGKPIGWKIQHTYRATNGVGALTIGTTRFELDSTLTKVLDARQMKNNL